MTDHPNRLLVIATSAAGDTYAEVAHEAIFHCWQKLRDWIAAEREFLAWRTGLEAARRAWQATPDDAKCDSLLMGSNCGAHTFPYIETRNPSATVEHEASTSKISEDQLFYCLQRGIEEEDAVNMIVNGFCKSVLKELPIEFAVEAQNLLAVSLEGAVG